MICAKNYEKLSKSVEVTAKVLSALFLGHGVYTKFSQVIVIICRRINLRKLLTNTKRRAVSLRWLTLFSVWVRS